MLTTKKKIIIASIISLFAGAAITGGSLVGALYHTASQNLKIHAYDDIFLNSETFKTLGTAEEKLNYYNKLNFWILKDSKEAKELHDLFNPNLAPQPKV